MALVILYEHDCFFFILKLFNRDGNMSSYLIINHCVVTGTYVSIYTTLVVVCKKLFDWFILSMLKLLRREF